MKTLDDVKRDMSELYDETKRGDVERALAAELANITGKFLKAYTLDLAERVFAENLRTRRIGCRDA